MPTGITETSAAAIDVVAAILQSELTSGSVLLNTITDESARVQPGAKSIKLPNAGSFTAADKVENTATSLSKLTLTSDTLNLSLYKHVVAEIEDNAREQSAVDIEAEYIQRMASSMVRQMESDIAGALVKAANDGQLSGTSNLVLTLDDIVDARATMNKAFVPKEDRFLAIPSDQEAAMLKLDNFINANQYGSREGLINGEIGRVYGFTVIVSDDFASQTEFIAYHKSHVAFARQQAPKFEKARSSLTKLSDELSLSMSYGVKQLDSGNRAVYYDETV